MDFHIGCPVWSFKGWVGNFYPNGTKPSEFLREYSKRLTTIEGNTTFYAVPAQKTIEQWVAETPETFRFCPKVPKAISHEGKLSDNIEAAHQFVDVMKGLGVRLGPMFLQLPPRFPPHLIGELQALLVGHGLVIVSGPTEAGVFTLGPATTRPMRDLDALAADPVFERAWGSEVVGWYTLRLSPRRSTSSSMKR